MVAVFGFRCGYADQPGEPAPRRSVNEVVEVVWDGPIAAVDSIEIGCYPSKPGKLRKTQDAVFDEQVSYFILSEMIPFTA